MDKKLTKILGMKKVDFDSFIETGEIQARDASLIPVHKLGDEMALSSVILSSLRLIKEFRKHILSAAKISTGGNLYVYTEVSFKEYPESRVDGMLLVVKSGTIKDAAIFEMKNGNNELLQDQIDKYVVLAKNYSIPKLITISNQFVTEPSQSPLSIRKTKSFLAYHFSWSYLLTIAHILLFDNDTNIADQDQVEIMREVIRYLENGKSGICGFTQMKPGWKSVVEKINSGTRLRMSDVDVDETVISWLQEEKDLALILSRRLGLFVRSGEARYKGKLKNRIEDDKKKLLAKKCLTSNLRIRGAVSDIRISALFEKRIISLAVSLAVPRNKKLRGQIGWIKKQLDKCRKRSEEDFDKIRNEIRIDILFKNTSKFDRVTITGLDSIYDDIRGREIKEFRILQIRDFGKNFSSRYKFVEILEAMLVDYFKKIVQHLDKWEQPAPKIVESRPIRLDPEDTPIKEENLETNTTSANSAEDSEGEIERKDDSDWPTTY